MHPGFTFPVAVIKSSQTQFRGGKVFSGFFISRTQSIIEGSHGRNSSRTFKQKPWRNTACWLAQVHAQLVSYTAQHCLARDIAAHSGLGP